MLVVLFVDHAAHLFQQVAGEDEVGEPFVAGLHDLAALSLPVFMTLVDEDDVLSDAHHRIHVVGIDDGGDVELLGDAAQQVVDDE